MDEWPSVQIFTELLSMKMGLPLIDGRDLIDDFVGWVVPKLDEISANVLMKPQTSSECLALSQVRN